MTETLAPRMHERAVGKATHPTARLPGKLSGLQHPIRSLDTSVRVRERSCWGVYGCCTDADPET